MSEISRLGLLSIGGSGAKKFLQGQLTCNLEEILPGQNVLAAHCNPQGRIISLFQLLFLNDQYYLLMPASLLPIAQAALKKYAVFFKVTLNDMSNDESLKKLIDQPTIESGIPHIYPETSEKFLPHELNLHKLNAISFNKGCYTGQEIIARMQYRGKLKNHMYLVSTVSDTPPIRGQEIFSETGASGSVVDYAHLGYNNYKLLVIASEHDVNTTPLFLDADRKNKLEFLVLPYSL
jgi:folate-binding protein YgfZ